MRKLIGAVIASLAVAGAVHAQGRGGQDWTTPGADAQRSSWLRADPKISPESMRKPGFQFLWKVKLNNDAKQLNALTAPALLTSYIGYRGFRSLAFVGGSSDNVFAIDTDLGRIEWQKHFPVPAQTGGSMACPGGMTANLARPSTASFPGAPQGGRGGGAGRGGAKSGVGEPGEGGVTISQANANAGRGPAPVPPPGGPGAPGGRGAAGRGPGGGGGFGRGVSLVYAISSDGMLHAMYVSNGDEPNPPIPFLPAGANAQGLIVVDNVAYAATTQGCAGAANSLWALDIASKEVTSWKPNSGSVAGSAGAAVGPDGILYVATEGGELAALEPKTLKLKEVYKSGGAFTSTPVIFQYKEKTLIAASTKDGRVHLMDTAALAKPLATSPASAGADFAPGALASWQDADGTRWLLSPTANAIAAWKVVDQNGAPALQSGWIAGNLASPLTPMIVNGVVFAVSSGAVRNDGKMTAAQIAQRSSPAVLHALDSATGKELWSSGKTITSFVPGSGLSAGGSQMYVGTYDGTLYAFGFWIEH